MVAADTIAAPADEHLMEDSVSKVETVVEDECDVPVQVEESRNPSPATTEETDTLPAVDTSGASATPTSNRRGGWFRRDGAEAAKPSSGGFWSRKQAQPEQDTLNLAALKDLDESAKKNEETGSPSNRPGGAQNETALVVRSEPVNVLWNVMSEAVRRSALWRAATRVQESSKAAAEKRAKQGAAMRHGIRRFFRRRNANDEQVNPEPSAEKQNTAPRRPWWRRFRRNRSQAAQSSAGETSTAIVPYNGGPSPVAVVMKKAAAGVTGTCMVIVGVPLLLFPVPGPGVAMIASGVYIVSTEFQFARSWLETVKNRFGNVFDRLGIEVATPETLPPPETASPPVLALPPSLPTVEMDENTKDSVGEEEKECINKNEDDVTLATSDEQKEVETNVTEAVTMRI